MTRLFEHLLDHGKGGAFEATRYEHGCAWTDGIATYSTGMNGLSHASLDLTTLPLQNGEQLAAETYAQRVLEAAAEMASWRILQVTGGIRGIEQVVVYGGRYSRNK